MQLPLQVTFEGFPHSDAVEAAVRKKAEKLEHFSHDIVSCRVSVALPEKLMRSPTFHVRVDDGAVIVGTGGSFPAAIVMGELTVEAPLLSVTFRRTVYVPAVEYVYVGLAAVESS